MTKEITIEDNKLILDSDRIFTGYESKTYSLESDNGKYICYKAVDEAWNESYKLSEISTFFAPSTEPTSLKAVLKNNSPFLKFCVMSNPFHYNDKEYNIKNHKRKFSQYK